MQSRRGRPRDEAISQALLTAAGTLLAEVGWDALTMEGVAARAGVAKQTVYRRWSSKAQLVADAVASGAVALPVAPLNDSGDIRVDLGTWLMDVMLMLTAPPQQTVVRALAIAAASDAAAAALLWEVLTAPEQRTLVGRLEAARAAGQVRQDATLTPVVDAVTAYVLFIAMSRQVSTEERVWALVDLLLGTSSVLRVSLPLGHQA